jgi:hypothetical protein
MAIKRIKLRRDSAEDWELADPVLAQGEPGWDTDNKILKIGDGTAAWSTLTGISSHVPPVTYAAVFVTPDDIAAEVLHGDWSFDAGVELTMPPLSAAPVGTLILVYDGTPGGEGNGLYAHTGDGLFTYDSAPYQPFDSSTWEISSDMPDLFYGLDWISGVVGLWGVVSLDGSTWGLAPLGGWALVSLLRDMKLIRDVDIELTGTYTGNLNTATPPTTLGEALAILDASEGDAANYTPSDSANWTGTDPTTIAEAIDRIAAALGPIA